MAESSGMSEADISAIMETLQAQQQLLHALYSELEEEREASATAASEALSMILRLQVEKATLNMEASQYKRMAEEKISHAENSLAMLEEIYSETEMEIAALEYQLQAYRCKLLSMGCNDFGTSEYQTSESVLLQRHDMHSIETAVLGKSSIRRLSSLPPLGVKDSAQKRSATNRGKSLEPMFGMSPEIAEQCADQGSVAQSSDLLSKPGEFGSTNVGRWDQIRRLLEQIEKIPNAKETEGEANVNANAGRVRTLFSQGSTNLIADGAREIPTADMNPANHGSPSNGDATVDSSNCSEVYDVFEVPIAEVNEIDRTCHCELGKRGRDNFVVEPDNMEKKLDSVSEFKGSCEIDTPYETDRVKKLLLGTNLVTKSSSQKNRTFCCKKPEDMYVGNTSPATFSTITAFEYQHELQKLYQRIERLENERNSMRQEVRTSAEEELNLLKEIKQKMNSIETQMRRCKIKDSTQEDDLSILPLQEAMLYFWM